MTAEPQKEKSSKNFDAIHPREDGLPPDEALKRDVQSEVIKRIAEEKKMAPFRPESSGGFPKGVIWGVVVLILIFVGSFGYYAYLSIVHRFSASVEKNIATMQSGVSDLRNLNPQAAGQKFQGASDDLGLTFGGFADRLKSLFHGPVDLIAGFQKLAGLGVGLTQEVDFFKQNFIAFTLNGSGTEVIAHLRTTQSLLKDVTAQTSALSSEAATLQGIPQQFMGSNYLPLSIDLGKFQSFLDAFIPWFASDLPRHLAVLFQNPSEIRPAGGFLGSYADVTVQGGNIASIDVHDINDADRQLALKIIPPVPLQAQVSRLRAADANWFFDFSSSSAEVINLLEASGLYRNATTTVIDASSSAAVVTSTPVTFDGAIAISPKIIEDVLGLVGPITLPKENITLTQDNFLELVQKQVQLGQASQSTYPKNVLKDLSAGIIAKLETLTDAEQQELLRLVGAWAANKDIMAYFKDPVIESSFENYKVAGTVYDLPNDFEGDYLALLDANIGNGKSDLFIKQTVTLESQISASGTVLDHLIIDREHQGNTSKDWWYQVPNQDYLQVFVPDTTQLLNASGTVLKTIYPGVNYAKSGYTTDPLVAEIASSTMPVFNYPTVSVHEESGKSVFSMWSKKIKLGEKTEIVLDYTRRLFLAPADGTQYTFVYEKQAGTERHYKFEISAPVGFKFKENDLPVYTYDSAGQASSTAGIPGRLIVNLTLRKL